jgi:hypothetical protein
MRAVPINESLRKNPLKNNNNNEKLNQFQE